MLGLILIYFVGRAFYRLAETYNRSKWLFAILGVVAYYVTQFIFQAVVLGFMMTSGNEITFSTEMTVILISILIGALGVRLFYFLLKRNWENNPKAVSNSDLLDQ